MLVVTFILFRNKVQLTKGSHHMLHHQNFLGHIFLEDLEFLTSLQCYSILIWRNFHIREEGKNMEQTTGSGLFINPNFYN